MIPVRVVMAVVLLSACAGPRSVVPPSPRPAGLPPLTAVERVSCHGDRLVFPVEAFSGPDNMQERTDDPAAAALADVIRRPMGVGPIPKTGWRLLYREEKLVIFGVGQPPELDMALSVELEDGKWTFTSLGGCTVRPWRPEVAGRPAEWIVNPDTAPIGADDRVIPVLVMETACTGGTQAGDRVEPPVIEYGPSEVLVSFYVRPLPSGDYNCPSNIPTPVEVKLNEPLGNRMLLDGNIYPPQEPPDSFR